MSGNRRSAYAAALTFTVIWGVNYSVAKRVLRELDPFAVACVRGAVAALFFGSVLLVRDGAAALAPRRLRRAALLGLLGIFGNQLLFITGLRRTSAAHSSIMVALVPVFVLVISALAGQEKITPIKIAGILIAFAGVFCVALEKGLDQHAGALPGDLLTLAGGLSFAAYTVAGKPVLRDLGPLRATGLAFVTGGAAIVLVTFPAATRQDWGRVSPGALVGLACVVVLATIVAYVLYYYALARIDPSQVAVFNYLQPVVAALVAFVIAKEPFSGAFLFGGGLVLAGILLAERG